MPRISYGPPGQVGVKTLQYVSGVDGLGETPRSAIGTIAKPVGAIALAVGAYAWVSGRHELRTQSLAVAAAAIVAGMVTR